MSVKNTKTMDHNEISPKNVVYSWAHRVSPINNLLMFYKILEKQELYKIKAKMKKKIIKLKTKINEIETLKDKHSQ